MSDTPIKLSAERVHALVARLIRRERRDQRRYDRLWWFNKLVYRRERAAGRSGCWRKTPRQQRRVDRQAARERRLSNIRHTLFFVCNSKNSGLSVGLECFAEPVAADPKAEAAERARMERIRRAPDTDCDHSAWTNPTRL